MFWILEVRQVRLSGKKSLGVWSDSSLEFDRSTLSFFGNKEKGWEHQDNAIKDTTLKRYIGFDNRLGLVSVAKRVQRGTYALNFKAVC
jgi:hypothetical protein